ncbi:hypothetical protein [Brevundimonas nasdae]|uniref:Lipoprotein n=1 Tax=Brevundimonas nasdae TaxID=172043 RepID=A0ABX8TIT5_9CAUL|nr:hypothetical protein [Brevundimonas nasdae]QYC10924.1 hypothetical protein KWG56_02620 [Brevundimonas nasdae]QYC13711.1 hypothetical protein KWG63_16175 [Brevundimonas nasdae]
MKKLSSTLAMLAVLGLAACGDKPAKNEAEATTDGAAMQAGADAKTPSAVAANVDLSLIPVSTAPLGAFPYVGAPAGYGVRDEKTMDLAAYPIWTGTGFQTVEGKVHMASSATPEDKTFSRLEVQRSLDEAVKALGGVQIANSEAPNPAIDELPQALRSDMNLGLMIIYGNPISAYVIRRPDKTIWVQVIADASQVIWTVVEAPPPPAPPAA